MQPSSDPNGQRGRRRPRLASVGPQSGSGSLRPSSKPRVELTENALPSLSPTVSPPATPVVPCMRARCSKTPPPVGWQYPSSSRCLVCGKLGCESCSVKVDPTATKQKLESLRLNTPYERAKLARTTEELQSEESRHRQRLMGRYESWLESLHAVELIRRHIVRAISQETAYRQELYREEQVRRSAYVQAGDQRLLLLALQSSEGAARHAIIALEREGAAFLTRHCVYITQFLRLCQRESITREALSYNESSQWHRLQSRDVEVRNIIGEHVSERQRLHLIYLDGRGEIAHQQSESLESIVAMETAHREAIRQHIQRRAAFVAAAERGKRDVVSEEATSRARLHEELLEEADYISERQRIFERQRMALERAEISQRCTICEAAEHGYHVIFVDMKADEEEVYSAEVARAERRHAELLLALETMSNIQREETAAFAALLQKESVEVEGRRAWIVRKAEERAALLHRWLLEKNVIAAEEESVRVSLHQSMLRSEASVVDLIEAKWRARCDLLAQAEASAEVLATEERKARLHFLSVCACQAELVVRACEQAQLARLAFMDEESRLRSELLRKEEGGWRAVLDAIRNACEALAKRLEKERQERTSVLQNAMEAFQRCSNAEVQERTLLCSEERRQRDRALDACHYRVQLELLSNETQHRATIVREATASRGEIRTKMALFAQYVTEAALTALRTKVCEMVAEEETVRACMYQRVDECYSRMERQQREEELDLIEAMEQRIRHELLSRQEYMKEDPRLYDSNDSLVIAPILEKERGTGTVASSAAGVHDLRRELVLQALGIPTSGFPLSSTAIDFLVSVMDCAGKRRDNAQEHFAVAERQAGDASKKVLQHEQLLSAEKEKKEMYELSSRREVEERERRIQQETQDKTRSQQAIVAEKHRLSQVQAELLQEQKILDALKGSINRQFSR